MNKKIWIAAAAVVVVLLLVILCLSVDKTETVGICYRSNTNKINTAYRTALEQSLAAQGIQLIVTDADEDQAKQLMLIEELADKKCDVLLVEPVMTSAGEELMNALDSTGLPAVLFNREIDESLLVSYPKITYIGTDGLQPGQLQGQMVTKLPDSGDINGDGIVSYMLIQGPEDHADTILRTQTFEDALAAGEKDIQRLVIGYGDWTLESGQKICRQQLAAYGKDIEVIVCGNDQIAIGAAQAIADGGRTVGEDIYLFGIDGEENAMQLIREGKMSGTVYNDSPAQISAITQTVLAQINGKPMENKQIIPYIAVTAENVQEYTKKA